MDFYDKYIKYKQKYLKLKTQHGGKLPYIDKSVNGNITKDYFPFDNNNFNYYFNDQLLIFNNEHNEDYLLNEKFELLKLDFDKKSDYNSKNIINNTNIYKLADEQIIISSDTKFPFHLCLLSIYKILDELYIKHININTNKIKYEYLMFKKDEKNEKNEILKNKNDQNLFKLNNDFKNTFLINNAKKVFKNIFNFNKVTNRILDITYNYNILLKYSYCNKFLELLKLIYDIQSKIDYTKFDIMTTDIKQFEQNDFKYLKILFVDDKYNLEEYIIINIINFFISKDSKNNFDKIYDCYNNQKSEDNNYNNAILTYINISDTTLLFKYILEKSKKNTTNELLKQEISSKLKLDSNSDLKSFKDHIEDDIKDIKQLLLFNLYVDNNIDISPKFSHIFYASFIYYRINKPLISYPLFSNLYPINKNNFICNLLDINNSRLNSLIDNRDNELSINKKLFKSNYIKHPIHSFNGFLIKTETYSYSNCVENAILEFIKILFWNQTEFEIRLPPENTNIELETKPLKLLRNIFEDINNNLTNIDLFYKSKEYNKKIDELFTGRNDIFYRNNDKTKSYLYPKYVYEMDSTIDNFYKMLCIILNFKTINELEIYLNSINRYNSDITSIIKSDETISIFIEGRNLYTITIQTNHTYLESINNININKLIEYDYCNLLIYYTNIISNYNYNDCNNYMNEYKDYLLQYKDHKNLEYIVILIIIKYPELSGSINYEYPNYMEIIYTAFEKNTDILCYIFLSDNDIEKICKNILTKFKENHPKYKDIVKCILKKKPEFIEYINKNNPDFLEIIIYSISMNDIMYCNIIEYLVKNHHDYINILLKELKKDHPNYKKIITCILREKPEFIKDIPIDHPDFSEIVINSIYVSGKCNYKIVDYLVQNHHDYINTLINTLLNTIQQDHYNINKLKLVCILHASPEFIKNIPINHPDFSEIVINSIKVNDKINYNIIDYLIANQSDYINLLLNKIIVDYPKHKYLVKYILNVKPEFIKNIPINHPNYSEIVKVENKNGCVCM